MTQRLSNTEITFLWEFARGEMEAKVFEKWLYNFSDAEALFDKTLYFDLISNMYSSFDEIHEARVRIRDWLEYHYKMPCGCSALCNSETIGMGHEKEFGFNFIENVYYKTPWTSLGKCSMCSTFWYIWADTDEADINIRRLSPEQAKSMQSGKNWPDWIWEGEAWTDQDAQGRFECSVAEWQRRTNNPRGYLLEIQGLKPVELDLTAFGYLITDEDMKLVSIMSSIRRLRLPFSIGDKGFEEVCKLVDLQSIDISGPFITNDGIAGIAKLTNLIEITLRSSNITALTIPNSKTLKCLDLAGTPISDDGLVGFFKCSHLENVCLTGTKVTSKTIAALSEMTNLKVLYISGIPVKDSDLSFLKTLSQLERLGLIGTEIGDSSLDSILTLKNLRWLGLNRRCFSEHSTAMIKKKLPKCELTIQ